jgi:hypothetical protein
MHPEPKDVTDAEPLSTSASPHGGDRARVETERHEEAATGGGREGVRGSRQIRDTSLRIPFSRILMNDVLAIGSRYRLPDLNEKLPLVLEFNYWTMRASHHMLTLAAHKENSNAYHGAGFSQWSLADYYRKHAREEKNHDRWLAKDLAAFGLRVSPRGCPIAAAALVGTVTYFTQFIDPASLLGWQLISECFPMPESALVCLEAKWGTQLLRTLRYHATHDRMHAIELCLALDNLDHDSRPYVHKIAHATAHMWFSAMQDIADLKRHNGACSNQNVLNPMGMWYADGECTCSV